MLYYYGDNGGNEQPWAECASAALCTWRVCHFPLLRGVAGLQHNGRGEAGEEYADELVHAGMCATSSAVVCDAGVTTL